MKVKTLIKKLNRKKFRNANVLISYGEGYMSIADKVIIDEKDLGTVLISTKN